MNLVAEGLVKRYRGRTVVNDVSLVINAGEIVGLLGPNGAGKTTTFYAIVGLIRPDAGRIRCAEEDLTRLPIHSRARRGVGYLPQETSVFRRLTVADNIRAVLELQPEMADPRRRETRVAELLDELHIAHLARTPAVALSGGERRRTEIARALAGNPRFMLLDEPFAGVDPLSVADIQNIILHLRRREIGVLITDHNVRETFGICDRAYILNEGRVIAAGTPAELVHDPEVRRVYLGESFRA
ncbi:MAG: LPS export ABC transporter ATP-binding protein [Gammaproteobacteria bacterium]|nr:LPS export ABC transporter ATP-binding protein [Gammaproteobacteria bacterium]